jgi:drug/metabolite transporter (DMT)-like permease
MDSAGARPGNLPGIIAMLVAVLAFAAMDGILKVLAGVYPAVQVGALRGAASLPFILLPLLASGGWRDLRPHNLRLHLLRGVLALIMMVGFIEAVAVLSLADAYAIFFVAPLLVTALSVPILGERVDWQRWVAIGVGLAGVLVMLQPTGSGLTLWGTAGALAAAVAYALSSITVRILTRTDSNASMVFWFLVLLTVFAGVLAAPVWVPVRDEDWPWLVGLGAAGAAGQYFITRAFRVAPASVIAPFEYTAMLWAAGLDRIFWGVLPGERVYAGGTLVVACGLYLIWRERALRVDLAARTEVPEVPR